jgi:hypothetical protein
MAWEMNERRKIHRRRFVPVTPFPLCTQVGELILSDLRMLPTRRINDIEVKELSCEDFISGLR